MDSILNTIKSCEIYNIRQLGNLVTLYLKLRRLITPFPTSLASKLQNINLEHPTPLLI